MTQPQIRETPSNDSPESLIFGICDRLYDHGNCVTDVVLVPADEHGAPDWLKADPANVESLPADEWPEDEKVAQRAAVIVDHVGGCSQESSFLVYLIDGQPQIAQISGRAEDRLIAEAVIARDIGLTPIAPPPSKLAESLAKLARDIDPSEPVAPPPAANDNEPQAEPPLTFLNPADWHGLPIPARQWYAPDLIPLRQVTILNGDGGVGKSLLALQIAAAGALAVDTLGIKPCEGKVLYIGAEDEADEFWRRLVDIARANDMGLDDLDRFRLLPLADRDALLAVPGRTGNLQPTPLFGKIAEYAGEFGPRLIVLDTAADLFGGDEIKRGQVRQFISMLRTIAIKLDCAVVLLAHPSLDGMRSGSGSSGSTAWNNSVRSRLYLTKGDKDDDPDIRVLQTMKSNYGTTGGILKLRWRAGAFILDDGKPPIGSALIAARAERVFREVLSAINRSGERVAKTKGLNYAPKVMAERPDAEGLSVKSLERAMLSLLASGELKVVMEGPPSKQRQRLILTSEDFGPE